MSSRRRRREREPEGRREITRPQAARTRAFGSGYG